MTHSLIITAAGSSSRMGGTTKKEYCTLPNTKEAGITVLSEALFCFLNTGYFSLVVITHPPNQDKKLQEILSNDSRLIPFLSKTSTVQIIFCTGGSTRQESVKNGLEKILLLTKKIGIPSTVLIHDGARPWLTKTLIKTVIEGTISCNAIVPATQPVDTQKEINAEGKIVRHLQRATLAAVQTPQGFLFQPLLEAHRKAALDNQIYTDDAEIWGKYVGDVFTCIGSPQNKKITFKEDFL